MKNSVDRGAGRHIHGGDLAAFREQYPEVPVLDFSANINPLGMPESVRRVLLESADACLHYPDPRCRALREAIAGLEGVPADWVLCGNGASDLISRIAWALRPRRALLLAPTFTDYERALTAAGCACHHHRLREEDGFAANETLLDPIAGVDVVFLCNPNNPTGLLLEPALLEKAIERCRREGAYLVVDECFLDFVPDAADRTAKRYLQDSDRLIILRAFTKIFAMPGLRLGYALCRDKDLLNRLENAGPSWSVSVPAQLCGEAAAGELDYLEETRRRVPAWREGLRSGLARLGCGMYPSVANYLFFRARPGLAEELRPRGLLLRDCSNYAGLREGYYRAAVRREEENHRLVRELEELLT